MISKKIEKILNEQIAIEAQAAQQYLAIAVWCDTQGFAGAAKFLYEHSDEERLHMLKLVNYVNDMGGAALISAIKAPKKDFGNIKEAMEYAYASEKEVTAAINKIVSLSLKENDHTTHNFIQWYVNEQLEEENLYRTILDRINLIGDGGNANYLIDLEIEKHSNNTGGMTAVEDIA